MGTIGFLLSEDPHENEDQQDDAQHGADADVHGGLLLWLERLTLSRSA
jgi:hypothetical protein